MIWHKGLSPTNLLQYHLQNRWYKMFSVIYVVGYIWPFFFLNQALMKISTNNVLKLLHTCIWRHIWTMHYVLDNTKMYINHIKRTDTNAVFKSYIYRRVSRMIRYHIFKKYFYLGNSGSCKEHTEEIHQIDQGRTQRFKNCKTLLLF